MRLCAATLLVAIGLMACGGSEKAPGSQEHGRVGTRPHGGTPSREVRTVEVARGGGAGEIAVPAVVQARRRITLAARIPASVVEAPYRIGQTVAAGAVVVRLDDGALRSALAAAEAALRTAKADYARTESLLAKRAATPRELDEMTARVAGAEAQVAAAKDSLSYAVLRAPFAGRIAARPVDPGDIVTPGMPLAELEGQDGLEIGATVEPALAAGLHVGDTLRAVVDGLAEPVPVKVAAVSASADPATHRFQIKASLPADPALRAGLFARLLVPQAGGEPRITVPASALFERGGLVGVFTASDGKARLRWIATGAREGDLVEVRAGLEAGERVVLDPAGLVDGAPVDAAPAAEQAR